MMADKTRNEYLSSNATDEGRCRQRPSSLVHARRYTPENLNNGNYPEIFHNIQLDIPCGLATGFPYLPFLV